MHKDVKIEKMKVSIIFYNVLFIGMLRPFYKIALLPITQLSFHFILSQVFRFGFKSSRLFGRNMFLWDFIGK